MKKLINEIQSIYRGADSSSGGVRVLKAVQHSDGSVTYVTSECEIKYFPRMRAVTSYGVVVSAVKTIEGDWLPSNSSDDSRYWIKTKQEAMSYFKDVVNERGAK